MIVQKAFLQICVVVGQMCDVGQVCDHKFAVTNLIVSPNFCPSIIFGVLCAFRMGRLCPLSPPLSPSLPPALDPGQNFLLGWGPALNEGGISPALVF